MESLAVLELDCTHIIISLISWKLMAMLLSRSHLPTIYYYWYFLFKNVYNFEIINNIIDQVQQVFVFYIV